jgi:hypothetical protein
MISHPGTVSSSPTKPLPKDLPSTFPSLPSPGDELDQLRDDSMDFSFAHSDRSKRRLEKHEEAMRDTIALLNSLGVRFNQPDRYTLKFCGYSYWPGTKRLHRQDDASSSKLQGLDELANLIQSFKRPLKS